MPRRSAGGKSGRGETAEADDLAKVAEFCQSILDWGGSPVARDHILARAGVDLRPSAFVLLRSIERLGPLTVTNLAACVGLHQSTVSAQLRPLISERLISRAVDDGDRRVIWVSITAPGRRICDRVRAAGAREWGIVLANWTEGDRRALAELVDRARRDTETAIEVSLQAASAVVGDSAGDQAPRRVRGAQPLP